MTIILSNLLWLLWLLTKKFMHWTNDKLKIKVFLCPVPIFQPSLNHSCCISPASIDFIGVCTRPKFIPTMNLLKVLTDIRALNKKVFPDTKLDQIPNYNGTDNIPFLQDAFFANIIFQFSYPARIIEEKLECQSQNTKKRKFKWPNTIVLRRANLYESMETRGHS